MLHLKKRPLRYDLYRFVATAVLFGVSIKKMNQTAPCARLTMRWDIPTPARLAWEAKRLERWGSLWPFWP